MTYLILSIGALCNVVASLLIKEGIRELSNVPLKADLQSLYRLLNPPFFILGLFFFALGFVVYSYTLTKIPLNIAYPVLVSITIVVLIFASYLFFKEVLSSVQIVGIVFIGLGIWLLSYFR